MARDAQYVPILPSFDGFFKSVEKGAQKGGEQAGKSFADSMQRQVKKAEGAVEKATIQVERSRKRQADSADKTRVMEAKLAEVMDKGNATASQKKRRSRISTRLAATRLPTTRLWSELIVNWKLRNKTLLRKLKKLMMHCLSLTQLKIRLRDRR